MTTFKKEFLERTIQVWQPCSSDPLCLDDAREIADNMVDLYSFLIELKQKHDQEEKKP